MNVRLLMGLSTKAKDRELTIAGLERVGGVRRNKKRRPISGLGQSLHIDQTGRPLNVRFAPKATVCHQPANLSLSAISGLMHRNKTTVQDWLLDHLVSAEQDRRRQGHADSDCSPHHCQLIDAV